MELEKFRNSTEVHAVKVVLEELQKPAQAISHQAGNLVKEYVEFLERDNQNFLEAFKEINESLARNNLGKPNLTTVGQVQDLIVEHLRAQGEIKKLTADYNGVREFIADQVKYREALGLLTTLAPEVEMDTEDPVGMAHEIVAYVQSFEVSEDDMPMDEKEVADKFRRLVDQFNELLRRSVNNNLGLSLEFINSKYGTERVRARITQTREL